MVSFILEGIAMQISKILLIALLMTSSIFAFDLGLPFTGGQASYSGARNLSLAGATTASPDANCALQVNPAGLGLIKQSGVFGTYSTTYFKANILDDPYDEPENNYFSRFSNAGFNYRMRFKERTVVLGLNYHRWQQFDFIQDLAYTGGKHILFNNDYVDLENVDYSYCQSINGNLNRTSVGCATELSQGLFIGGSIQFWNGFRDCYYVSGEIIGQQTMYFHNGSTDISVFPDLTERQAVQENYSGINLSAGLQYCLEENLKIALSCDGPVTIRTNKDEILETVQDYSNYTELINLDPDSITRIDFQETSTSYSIQRPLTLRLGGLVEKGIVSLSADLVWTDYSQMRYEKSGNQSAVTRIEHNRAIKKIYVAIIEPHVGMEINIPNSSIKFRCGYAKLPKVMGRYIVKSAYMDNMGGTNMNIFGLGISFKIKDQIKVDVGYAQWAPDAKYYKETIKTNQLQVSMTCLMP